MIEPARSGGAASATSEQAPVVVFHIERSPGELTKISGILKGNGIGFKYSSSIFVDISMSSYEETMLAMLM